MIEHIVGRRSRGFSDVGARDVALGEPLLELRGVSAAAQAATMSPRRCIAARWWAWPACSAAAAARWRACSAASSRWPPARSASRASRSTIGNPRGRDRAGIALVPEDRRRQGFVAVHSVASNICLPILDRLVATPGFVSQAKATRLADEQIKRLRIKTASRDAPVRTLSGGNAQKVVIAKWLATEPRRADPRRADRRHRHRLEVGDHHADPRSRQVRARRSS